MHYAGFFPLLNEVAQHALHNMDHLDLIGLQSEIGVNRSKRFYYFKNVSTFWNFSLNICLHSVVCFATGEVDTERTAGSRDARPAPDEVDRCRRRTSAQDRHDLHHRQRHRLQRQQTRVRGWSAVVLTLTEVLGSFWVVLGLSVGGSGQFSGGPRFVGGPVFEVNVVENTPPGTVIIRLEAHDADEGRNGEIRYSFAPSTLASPAARVFHIRNDTGELTVKVRD